MSSSVKKKAALIGKKAALISKYGIGFLIFNLIILSGCVQSTAMLGPALTAASTGNVLQTGFSYGANLTIKKTTGKNTSEHIVDYKAKKRIEK